MLRACLKCVCVLHTAYMFGVCVKCACCMHVVSLQCVSAEVWHKFNCIFIFSQNSRQLWRSNGKGAASRTIDQWFRPPRELCMLRVCLQCLCGLHSAYIFEVCIKCALMLIVCSMCVLKLGLSFIVYLFFLQCSNLLL